VSRAPLAARVARELDGLRLAPGTWLVAVSGGPDSVALLLLLSDLAASRGLSLVAAHVDHGIHPASADVAARVEQLAQRRGLPLVIGRLALGADATETDARDARYAWLRDEARRQVALGIITGHHADDQAETVLMRALRGSGPAGLAGMSRRAGDLVRPLLPFRREELAQYLLERGEDAWLDPANTDPRHLRSWLRASLLPRVAERLPDVTERLLALAAQARLEREAWDEALERLPGIELRAKQGRVSLGAAAIASFGAALGAQALRAASRRTGHVLSLAAARRALRLARDGESGQRVDLGHEWTAELSFGRLVLSRPRVVEADLPVPEAGSITWSGWTLQSRLEPAGRSERAGWAAWMPAGDITVGAPRPGERLRPLGGSGSRSIARLLQEARVSRGERLAWPVLRQGDRPVWVPGVSRSDDVVPHEGQEAVRIDVRRD